MKDSPNSGLTADQDHLEEKPRFGNRLRLWGHLIRTWGARAFDVRDCGTNDEQPSTMMLTGIIKKAR
jgi:hypothetical protein